MASLYPFPRNLGKSATRSMSFLFVLKEFEDGFETILHLQKFTAIKLQGAHLSDEIGEVIRTLDKFYLFSHDNPFMQKSGILDVLCFYSEILLQASTAANENTLMVLEEMRMFVLRFGSKLIAWKRNFALHPLDAILTTCLETYNELLEKMRQFFNSLTPNFHESSTDENVLMYLVEKREKLNSYLGDFAIENLLKSFFPTGISRLRTAICEGYIRRGFAAFYAEKEPLLDTLELELEELESTCSIAHSR